MGRLFPKIATWRVGAACLLGMMGPATAQVVAPPAPASDPPVIQAPVDPTQAVQAPGVRAPVDEAPVVQAPADPAPVAIVPTAPAPAPDVNNPVKQATEVVKDLATGDVKALRRGPLLIHGNYCGIGNRPGTDPIDALDAACMHHDSCTKTGKLPSCSCDERLRKDALAIAQDPTTPQKIQALATTMAASMVVLICK